MIAAIRTVVLGLDEEKAVLVGRCLGDGECERAECCHDFHSSIWFDLFSDRLKSRGRLSAGNLGGTDLGKRKRSEEHTSELQSLMRISYAVFCLKKKKNKTYNKAIKQDKHKNITNIKLRQQFKLDNKYVKN